MQLERQTHFKPSSHFLENQMKLYDTGNFCEALYLWSTVHIPYLMTWYLWIADLYAHPAPGLCYKSKEISSIVWLYILEAWMLYVLKNDGSYDSGRFSQALYLQSTVDWPRLTAVYALFSALYNHTTFRCITNEKNFRYYRTILYAENGGSDFL